MVTEFSAALSIKYRTRRIDAGQRAAALSAFSRFCGDSAVFLPIESQQFRTAALSADQYERGIKSGDALHLAICQGHGATLCTLDRALSEAGPPLGVATLLV